MSRTWFTAILVVLLLGLLFIYPSLSFDLKQILFPDVGFGEKGDEDLAIQNLVLRAQLAELRDIEAQLPENSPDFIKAFIYSRYPFNFKNEILLNVGKKHGVSAGQAVVLPHSLSFSGRPEDTVLIGRVGNVFNETAIVETVFDSRFRLAVRVGEKGGDALLLGGSSPQLTLVSKRANVTEGETVYSAGADFPYGLAIGEVYDLSVSRDNLFQEGSVRVPYDPSALRAVLVIKSNGR